VSARDGGVRRLQRFPSIRAKLGSIIIVAVGVTLGLVYLLLSVSLRNDFREVDLVRLLRIAQADSRTFAPTPPPDVSFALLRDGVFTWTGPELREPPRFQGGVHVGTLDDIAFAAVPQRIGGVPDGPDGMLYAVQTVPGFLEASLRFLTLFWTQLAVAGMLGAGLAIAFARWLARGMTRPLRDMAVAARRLETGDYAQRVRTDSRDEVGQLAQAFNAMAAELGAIESLRRDLVANVSHELKTPISALRAHLENLLDGVEEPDPATLEVMLAQSERLGRLVEQLLDLSRLESGTAELVREPVDVAALVERVRSEIAVARGERGAAVSVAVADDLPRVDGDRERLHQVLYNLLDNAVRYTPDDGRVTVRASSEGTAIRVEVEDTGPGIPEDQRARVFERFYRLDPSRSRGDGGTGIGLAIARSIVEAHDGRIWVDAAPEGGSRFVVELPIGAGAPAATR
jgi:signal transduction histidine kinase